VQNNLICSEICNSADFQGVSTWQHTQAQIFGHTLLFAYMHTASALTGL